MSQRYIGSSISPTAAPTSSTSTTGVWSLNDQYQAKNVGNWPMYVPPVTTDPYFPYVSMLLPGNGTNGAQNNTFLDSSTNNFTITRNGNTTQGTFSPYGSNWSNYFSGSTDYLSAPSNAAFAFSGAFTVEGWFYWPSMPSAGTLCGPLTANAFNFYCDGTNLGFNIYGSGNVCAATMPSRNAWHHIAMTRNGSNNCTIWIDGVSAATGTSSFSFAQGAFAIYGGSNNGGAGYVSNFRIINGTAVYTSAFTPSTTPLTAITNTQLLTCQSNRFIDNSTNNFTITKNGNASVQRFSPFNLPASYDASVIGGSAYFDGSGDGLSTPNATPINFEAGDFTIECWAYFNNISSEMCVINKGWQSANPYASYLIFMAAGGVLKFGSSSSGGSWDIANDRVIATMVANTWTHIAITRSGTTFRAFVNGTLISGFTFTSSSSLFAGAAQTLYIGGRVDNSSIMNGYISNTRLVKGTAVYTTSFTPPTAPVTAITNTSLLINGTNAGIIDNAEINDLETVGNTQISTTQSKFGGSSMYFDGAGDYLQIPTNQVFAYGTGDFTIELWAYVINLSSIRQFYESYAGDLAGRLLMVVETNGNVKIQGQGGAVKTSGGTVPLNTWTHIAVTKASGSMRIFVNGTQVNTTYTDSSTYTCTEPVKIGINGYDNSSYPFLGYMDDYRITKGYARYTANFTPPTAAFPTA